MATKTKKTATAVKKKKAAPKVPPKPVTYVAQVMFYANEVQNKNVATDNMDSINPICINDVHDGDVVAVYEFKGLQRVTKSVTFTDAPAGSKPTPSNNW